MKQPSDFSDITLAHEDCQYIRAHKVILSVYCTSVKHVENAVLKKNNKITKKNIKHKTTKKT